MGRKVIDITGQKFGRLTVLYKLHNYHKKDGSYWLCVCDCGNIAEILGIKYNTVKTRFYNHDWSIERALGLEGKP